MKIEVIGNKELLDSILVSSREEDIEIQINTKDRWLPFQCGGSVLSAEETIQNQLSKFLHGSTKVDHKVIEISARCNSEGNEADVADTCWIILIAENSDESDKLRFSPYESQEKDQIHILFTGLKIPKREIIALWKPQNDKQCSRGMCAYEPLPVEPGMETCIHHTNK